MNNKIRITEIKQLLNRFKSIEKSHSGADYNDVSFKPVEAWEPVILDVNKIDARGCKLRNKSKSNKKK
ncbi:hypothetical protein [Lutibacter citreus]|uniref:hypothetical protein n=1 Tax=Lutibacter citreus TaxID=2138210 RepID=UPI000DBE7FAC|nr:hypothetical protein [Lutibacter citreus]